MIFMSRPASFFTPPKLSALPEGTVIYIEETQDNDSIYVPYVIARHNYEPELNGAGRTLVVRRFLTGTSAWGSANTAPYPDSTINSLLQSFIYSFGPKVRQAIGETTFCATLERGPAVGVMSAPIFTPSVTEYGLTYSYANVEGTALAAADKLLIGYTEDGSTAIKWTRSTYNQTSGSYCACGINTSGSAARYSYSTARGVQPCFTLPETARVDAAMRLMEGTLTGGLIDGPWEKEPGGGY